MKKKSLTPKQKIFCKEYVIDLNGTQAAIRAGYSKKTANRIAAENLTKPVIKEYIQQQQQKRSEKLEITADRVLQERAKIAFFNVKDLYHEDGTLKQLHEIDDRTAAAIHGVTMGGVIDNKSHGAEQGILRTYIKKIKTISKDKSLEALEKHLGIYEKDNEQKGNADLKTKQEFMEALLQSISKSDRGLPKP